MNATEKMLAEARSRGADAARTAASWVSKLHPVDLLAMLAAGDPAVDDYLPTRPDLSGQWADSETPQSLYGSVTRRDDIDPELCQQLSEAWESAVDETFIAAIEAELKGQLERMSA